MVRKSESSIVVNTSTMKTFLLVVVGTSQVLAGLHIRASTMDQLNDVSDAIDLSNEPKSKNEDHFIVLWHMEFFRSWKAFRTKRFFYSLTASTDATKYDNGKDDEGLSFNLIGFINIELYRLLEMGS